MHSQFDMPSVTGRYHGLDALRASMMLLGIYLHVSLSYRPLQVGDMGTWPKDANTHLFFDYTLFFIHAFRMPLFFLLAGFFGALLSQRKGAAGFLRNRAMRVLVPLVLFLLPLLALTKAAIRFRVDGSTAEALRAAGQYLLSRDWLQPFGFVHLWFLYFLVIYYALAYLAVRLFSSPGAPAAVHRGFSTLLRHPLGLLVFTVPTFFALFIMRGVLSTSTALFPNWAPLLFNLLFFAGGWLLYGKHELLALLQRRAWLYTAVGSAAALLHAACIVRVIQGLPQINRAAFLLAVLAGALAPWLLSFGLVGLSARAFSQERPWVRYISDSSYWLYLMHLPFAIALPGLLVRFDWPPAVKLLVVLAALTAGLLVSYRLLVRRTWLGLLLHGRKSPARIRDAALAAAGTRSPGH